MSKEDLKLDVSPDDENVSSVHSNETPQYISWLYKVDELGVEMRGIERVTSRERISMYEGKSHSKARQFMYVLGLWVAACGGLTSMSSFFYPTLVYGLNLRDSLISGIISMVLGCLVPAYTSTMGAKSGCRQMVSARFLFGQWMIKFIALICIIGGIGWSVVNCLLGGQVLLSISDSKVPLTVGIILIAIISLIVAVFGIKIVLKFQTLTAIPITIAVILFYVVVCKKADFIHESNKLVAEAGYTSATSRGNWLSFFTIGYSVTATWGSGAADYYILFPENTPSYQVFLITFLGISIPTTFVAIAGTICGNIAFSYKPWNDAYNANGVGGLIDETFKPFGKFGKFVVVLLYISLVCNNIMNTYSVAFEFQLIDTKLAIIPRWCWALLVTIIYTALSIAGKNSLSTIISNFLPMLGYWISMYITILLEENIIFRSTTTMKKLHYKEFSHTNVIASGEFNSEEKENAEHMDWLYNWNNWNKPKFITLGLAATLSFGIGVVGAVLGMNQIYYQGVLARKLGSSGGDIGFWLAMAFSGIVYPPLRYLELKRFGK